MIHNIDITVPAALPAAFGSSLRQNSLWTLHNTEGGYMHSTATKWHQEACQDVSVITYWGRLFLKENCFSKQRNVSLLNEYLNTIMWPLTKHSIAMYSKQDAEIYPKDNQPEK